MNVKTADMMKADDLPLWEIKTNYSGNTKTISRALQDAKRQAENAVIRIVATECDMKAIHKAAKLRKEYSKLENIIIICDGSVVFV